MIDNGRVCGDNNEPLFIASDFIYVRSNFTKVENPRMSDDEPVTYHYEFDEKKYTVDEYTRLQSKQSSSLQNQVVSLQLQLAESEEGISL